MTISRHQDEDGQPAVHRVPLPRGAVPHVRTGSQVRPDQVLASRREVGDPVRISLTRPLARHPFEISELLLVTPGARLDPDQPIARAPGNRLAQQGLEPAGDHLATIIEPAWKRERHVTRVDHHAHRATNNLRAQPVRAPRRRKSGASLQLELQLGALAAQQRHHQHLSGAYLDCLRIRPADPVQPGTDGQLARPSATGHHRGPQWNEEIVAQHADPLADLLVGERSER